MSYFGEISIACSRRRAYSPLECTLCLSRSSQQLNQKLHDAEKQFRQKEEKLVKELRETKSVYTNQLNESKHRFEQLESDNERLRRDGQVQVQQASTAPAQNGVHDEERQQLEKEISQLQQRLNDESEQAKKKLNEIQVSDERSLSIDFDAAFRLNIKRKRMNYDVKSTDSNKYGSDLGCAHSISVHF